MFGFIGNFLSNLLSKSFSPNNPYSVFIIMVVLWALSFTFFKCFKYFWEKVWPSMKSDIKKTDKEITEEMHKFFKDQMLEHEKREMSSAQLLKKFGEVHKSLAEFRIEVARKMIEREECNKHVQEYLNLQIEFAKLKDRFDRANID